VRPHSPLTRLGLAVTATLLGLATVTSVATADPTADPTTDPSTAEPSSSEPAQPSSSPAPPSSAPETPPSTDTPTTAPVATDVGEPGATRPLNSVLTVTMAFTKDTYGEDEAPVVRVALTNKGDMPLTDIVATCDHGESYPNLTGTGDGWGALAGDGVAIPAGTTKAVAVTEPMPAPAADFGHVRVDCAFRQSNVDYGANPRARAEAAVPGQLAEFSGEITDNDPAASRAGFRVLLFGKGGHCPVVAEGTSDAAGRFSLGQLPVGQYEMYVVPPSAHWFFKYGNHVPVDVIANRDNDNYVVWVYEDDHDNANLERQPNCAGGGPTTSPPAPQGSATPDLAHTGVNLALPGFAGTVALLLGAGALLLTRRRRTG
jgi:hypothetical protein